MSWGASGGKEMSALWRYMVEKGNKLACADEHCGYTEDKRKETE